MWRFFQIDENGQNEARADELVIGEVYSVAFRAPCPHVMVEAFAIPI